MTNAGWHLDERNRLILIRVPPQVSLNLKTSACWEESVAVAAAVQPATTIQSWNDTNSDLGAFSLINLDPAPLEYGKTTTTISSASSATASADSHPQLTTMVAQKINPTPSPTPAPDRPGLRLRQTGVIAALPPELVHEILSYLHPIDRVCVGLTCKALLSATMTAPQLSPTTWSQFTDRRYDWLLPDSHSLILRLAHGWIPKDRLRYCWKCHLILPRDESYFRRRLVARKEPRWSMALDVTRDRWAELSKKQKYDHLVDVWCHSPAEDSSLLYCDFCSPSAVAIAAASSSSPSSSAAAAAAAASCSKLLRHPVQCPLCTERELTYVFKPPRSNRLGLFARRAAMYLFAPIEFLLCCVLVACHFCASMATVSSRHCRMALRNRGWAFQNLP